MLLKVILIQLGHVVKKNIIYSPAKGWATNNKQQSKRIRLGELCTGGTIKAGDFNNDGKSDIACIQDYNPILLRYSTGYEFMNEVIVNSIPTVTSSRAFHS